MKIDCHFFPKYYHQVLRPNVMKTPNTFEWVDRCVTKETLSLWNEQLALSKDAHLQDTKKYLVHLTFFLEKLEQSAQRDKKITAYYKEICNVDDTTKQCIAKVLSYT